MKKIYLIKDRIAMTYGDIMIAHNSSEAVRMVYPYIQKRPDGKDLELYEAGEIDEETGLIKGYDAPHQKSWDDYKFETRAKKETVEEHQQVEEMVREAQEERRRQEETNG